MLQLNSYAEHYENNSTFNVKKILHQELHVVLFPQFIGELNIQHYFILGQFYIQKPPPLS